MFKPSELEIAREIIETSDGSPTPLDILAAAVLREAEREKAVRESREAPTMPANSIRIASASEGTMLKWLRSAGYRPLVCANYETGWRALAGALFAEGPTPVAALRKLCREVVKQEGKAYE